MKIMSALDARVLLIKKTTQEKENINFVEYISEKYAKHINEEIEKAVENKSKNFSILFERNDEGSIRYILGYLGYYVDSSCYDDKNPDYIELHVRF